MWIEILVGLIIIYTIYYLAFEVKKPELVYNENSTFNKSIISKMPILTTHYWPHFFFTHYHPQLILGTLLLHKNIKFKFDERIILPVGDGKAQVSLDLVGFKDSPKSKPTLVIFHGLTGQGRDYHILIKMALAKKWKVVGFNRRGHDGVKLLTPDMTKAGFPQDAHIVFQHLHEKNPDSNLYAVGISAGAAMLSSYVGRWKQEQTNLKGAVLVSHVHDYAGWLDQVDPFYDKIMHGSVKKFLMQHKEEVKSRIDLEDTFGKTKLLTQWEREHGFKLHGYSDLKTYLEDNNPLKHFGNATIPVMSISSKDDPVCHPHLVPNKLFKSMERAIQVNTHRGSHIMFLEGLFTVSCWYFRVTMQYFEALEEESRADGTSKKDQ